MTATVQTKDKRVNQTKRKDAHSVSKRLQQELMTIMMSGSSEVSAFPDGDNIFKWIGTVKGPKGTVYEGLSYKLTLEFPADYPFSAPTIKFKTACFHPNVDEHGNICLDILKEKWSAVQSVHSMLVSIQSLLGEPNNDSPLNTLAAETWCNQPKFKELVHQFLKKSKDEST
ncbi:putative ubiquitin-conjugating enzyme E2 C-like [Apostichopus japonicus]|uniref:Putative ubiquitin-conjugating enzyme E2 C-like n=2 Tax=Stichopus japonicus TaxID=307972 RepID=A0A2G8KC38_STIJA|nr:putative ubiquitin-conjugating enzyme E2 C-like [Apostichopus japonicus]